jgi:hypothetical protein
MSPTLLLLNTKLKITTFEWQLLEYVNINFRENRSPDLKVERGGGGAQIAW